MSGSRTISWSFSRTNSAAVSLALLSRSRSLKAPRNGSPPRSHRRSYSARRSSSVTSRADRSARSHARAERAGHQAVLGPELGVVRLDLLHLHRVERLVPRRHGEGGRALEHGELGGLLGDDRDRLDGRRPGADDPDPLTGEVHRLMGPPPGVERRALERLGARDVGDVGGAQAARGHHEEPGRHVVALVGARPASAAASSSKAAAVTRVESWMSRRRSNRSATWLA